VFLQIPSSSGDLKTLSRPSPVVTLSFSPDFLFFIFYFLFFIFFKHETIRACLGRWIV